MMKIFYSLSLAILLLCGNTVLAQNFTKPGFELTLQDTPCRFVSNKTINDKMIGVAAFGVYEHVYLLDTSCNEGQPQEGNYYIGISADTVAGDVISLRLSNPLVPGNNYLLTYYEKRPLNFKPIQLEIGYSNDSTTSGNAIQVMPLATSNNWTQRSLNFSPTSADIYITLRGYPIAPSFGDSGMIHVDNFNLTFSTGVNNISSERNLQITPNPANDHITVVLNSDAEANVRITDMSGRMLYSNIYKDSKAKIDISSLPAGLYMLHADDGEYKRTEKFVITR